MAPMRIAAQIPRPLRYGLALTSGYTALSLLAFVVLDTIIDHFLHGNAADVLDRIEWQTAGPFVLVSSLLFLMACVALLTRLLERTQALQRADSQRMLAEQRALLGAMSASILHDCNNMLMVVRGNALLLEDYAPSLGDEGRIYLERLEEGLQNLTGLIGRFMKYSATPERTTIYDLGLVAEECADLVRHHPRLAGRSLVCEAQPDVPIEGNLLLIWSAVTNLVLNAAEATAPGGRIEVRCRSADGHVHLEVHDDGPGVPEHVRNAIFDPFYSTKREGHGLGLLSVSRCADAHGGAVTITRSPLGGACFALAFPALSGP